MAPEAHGLDAEPETDDQIGSALRALAAGYPGFRFFREPRGWHRQHRWIAERVKGAEPGLHTVITADFQRTAQGINAGPRARLVTGAPRPLPSCPARAGHLAVAQPGPQLAPGR